VGGPQPAQGSAKSFSHLLGSVLGARIIGDPQVEILGLAYDSRRVEPGSAFICVRGERTDGHDFIPQALERGARALIVEEGRESNLTPPPGGAIGVVPDPRAAMASVARAFNDDPSSRLLLAGVTGTNGKTTTALMIDAIFRAAGCESGVIGTVEYRVGPKRIKPLHTTPEAVDLQALLAEMLQAGATHAAMEVSSHALALHRADGCQFDVAVFTNLTPEHLDFHTDMQDYLAAKLRLFEDPQFLPRSGDRVNAINIDDASGPEIARRAQGKTLTYSLEREANCRAEQIELTPEGSRFSVHSPDGRYEIAMKLVGRFNVYNALAALTACAGLGIPPEAVQSGLLEMPPVPGRFQRLPSQFRTVLVDYAHTPDSLARALETARQIADGRLIVVFGCGGDRDRTKRPVMGEIAARLADRCLVTSDNPRSEPPQSIIDQILEGIPEPHRDRCLVEPDRAKAIRIAIQQADPEDVVLIAGKGHEDYQIFADRTVHFDDREVAAAVLGEIEGEPRG